MVFIVEYRTISVELMNEPDFWYQGDNEHGYASFEDAVNNSETVQDWKAEYATDLTVVRIREESTGNVTYISPNPITVTSKGI